LRRQLVAHHAAAQPVDRSSEYLREGKNGKQRVLEATGKFVPRLNIPMAYTTQGNYPQPAGKIVGCVTSNSKD